MAGKKPVGRPSKYSLAVGLMICDRLTEREPETGRLRALREICKDEDMPGERTVYSWLAAHEEFRQHYARARDTLAEMVANDIVNIADEELDPQRARVRIDARKWWVSKVAPKKYGDKVEHEHSGSLNVRSIWAALADRGKATALAEQPAEVPA